MLQKNYTYHAGDTTTIIMQRNEKKNVIIYESLSCNLIVYCLINFYVKIANVLHNKIVLNSSKNNFIATFNVRVNYDI